MGHYGSLTMKRHVCWSNAPTVQCLDLGTMTKEFQKRFDHKAKSAKKYKNKRGQPAYCGSKFLKQTGSLVSSFQLMVHQSLIACGLRPCADALLASLAPTSRSFLALHVMLSHPNPLNISFMTAQELSTSLWVEGGSATSPLCREEGHAASYIS